jgi:hypothetical protein
MFVLTVSNLFKSRILINSSTLKAIVSKIGP